jgi:protein involved in polysaccharide export with SLBB domain
MSRRKRTSSRALQNASARAAGIESIDPALDLGGGLTIAAYNAAIQDTREKQTRYNTLLAESDEAANVFEAAEAGLRDLTERMLAAVSAKFGRDSNQYEQAGGKRKSDRKRATRVAATPPVIKAA